MYRAKLSFPIQAQGPSILFFFFLNYQMWHFLLILLLPSFEKGSYITITQNDMNFLRLSELKQREHFWLFGALKLLNAVSHTVP